MANLTMKIKGRTFYGSSFAEMSRIYSASREASGKGMAKFPPATITEAGKPVARVSYNGRVWPMEEWTPGQVPLYDNRLAAEKGVSG